MTGTSLPPDAIVRINDQLADLLDAMAAATPTTEPVAIGVVWRNSGVLTVSVGIPPAFSDHPDDTTVEEGNTASFSVTASNATSYQWQKQESGAGAWGNVSGATSSSYTTGTLTVSADNTDKYRCVATGAGGSTTSNSATLTVSPAVIPNSPAFSWLAEDYSATPTPHIPNQQATEAVDANHLRGGQRLSTRFLSTELSTLTLAFADGFDGTPNQASRFNFASGTGNLYRTVSPVFTAGGQYTFSVRVKSNTGSSQSFRYGFSGGGASVQTGTATTSWQRFTHTATFSAAAAPTLFIAWSPDGTTGLDILIDDIRVDSGASAGTSQPFDGHLYLGLFGVNTGGVISAPSAGAVTLSANKPGLAQFATAEAFQTSFTLCAWVKQTAVGPAVGGLISKENTGYTALTLGTDTGGPRTSFHGNPGLPATVFDLNGQGWHLLSLSYDGAKSKMYCDDILIEQAEIAASGTTVLDMAFNELARAGSLFYPGEFSFAAKYDSVLTQSQLKAVREYGRGLRVANGDVAGKLDTVYVCEGDSISDISVYSYVYPTKFVSSLSEKVYCVLPATSGSTIATATAQRAAWVDSICASGGSDYSTPRRRILSILLGANDALSYASAQLWCDALDAYVIARRAAQNANDKVIIATLLPNQNSGFNTRRNAINTILRTWVGLGKCDALADFAAEATVGVDAASANATYYPDGVHPSNATHTLLGPIMAAAIEAVL